MDIRVGFGFDSHPLLKGRKLILGGVEIPGEYGPSGVSDADAVIHALCDALLGALGEKDIGEHFPEDGEENAGRFSIDFLTYVWDKVKSRGYKISNVDVTIVLDKPSLKTYKEKIKANLARLLEINQERVSIKAKHSESSFPSTTLVCFSSLILYQGIDLNRE